MKITFEVGTSRKGFYFTEPNDIDNTHLWPKADDLRIFNVELEFEQTSNDVMKEAETVLDDYMKKNYPNEEYKIYYWWWK